MNNLLVLRYFRNAARGTHIGHNRLWRIPCSELGRKLYNTAQWDKCWPADLPGSRPTWSGNLSSHKRSSIAHSLLLSPSYPPNMTEILLKRTLYRKSNSSDETTHPVRYLGRNIALDHQRCYRPVVRKGVWRRGCMKEYRKINKRAKKALKNDKYSVERTKFAWTETEVKVEDPATTWRRTDVVVTSMRRHYVTSTWVRHHCLLCSWWWIFPYGENRRL